METAAGISRASVAAGIERAVAGSGWTMACLALVAAYVAVGYAVAAATGLPMHWPLVHLERQLRLVLLLVYAPLVGAFLIGEFSARPIFARLRSYLFSARFFFELVAALAAVHVTLTIFVNLKQYVPAINPALYDSPLWRLDRWLHLGVEPAPLLSEWSAHAGLLGLLDQAYLIFFPVQVIVPLLFLTSTRLRPRRGAFFFSYCLLWMVGGLMYVVWPSLGPVYYWPSRFLWMEDASYARHLQWVLMQDYVRFRTDPGYYTVKLYYGVAALPSLHVGMIALFAMATRRWRSLSVMLWALTFVTFIGSMALGWHYAVDGYAGAILALGCWWLARRLLREDDREVPPLGDPVAARPQVAEQPAG